MAGECLSTLLIGYSTISFDKFKKPIDQCIATFAIIMMVILVICVVWQVVSRYLLNSPSTLTDEIARFSMIWVGLLGAAYTVDLKKHLSIDLFTHHLSGTQKRISNLIINIFIFDFAFLVMISGGCVLFFNVYQTNQNSPAMQIPMAYVYAVLPLSGVVMAYYSLLFILEDLVGVFTHQ